MKKYKKILFYCSLLIISFFICYQCDTNPFVERRLNADSSVFIYIGEMIKKGFLPYRDVFDNKGPLLYLINFLGVLFTNHGYMGIWLIEVIFMFFDLVFIDKICRLFFNNRIFSIFIISFLAIPIATFLEGGNYSEEYAMPFILMSLYYFIKYILYPDKYKYYESLITGISMAFVLLLRPNMITLWLVYCFVLLFDFIKKKKFVELSETIFYFFVGLLSVLSILLLILSYKGILIDCIKEYIIFNFKYTTVHNVTPLYSLSTFLEKTSFLFFSFCMPFVYLFFRRKNNINMTIASIIYLLLTLLLIILPGRIYGHYMLFIIPAFIIPILMYFDLINSFKNIYVLIIGILFIMFLCKDNMSTVFDIYNNLNTNTITADVLKTVINKNTEKDDKIIVFGNESRIYLETKHLAASKHIIQLPAVYVDSYLMDNFVHDLDSCSAKLILYTKFKLYSPKNVIIKNKIDTLLKEKKYKELTEVANYVILKRND